MRKFQGRLKRPISVMCFNRPWKLHYLSVYLRVCVIYITIHLFFIIIIITPFQSASCAHIQCNIISTTCYDCWWRWVAITRFLLVFNFDIVGLPSLFFKRPWKSFSVGDDSHGYFAIFFCTLHQFTFYFHLISNSALLWTYKVPTKILWTLYRV